MSKIGSSTDGSGRSIVSTNYQNVYRELQRVRETTRFGHLYRTRTQRLDGALPFVHIGLEQGEQCLYMVDGTPRDAVIEELSALDVDVHTALGQDQLRIVSQDEFETDGTDRFFDRLEQLVNEAGDDAFDGLRVVVDIPWGDIHGPDFEEFVQYRTGGGSEVSDGTVLLCQHDVRPLDETEMLDVAQRYPKLVYQGKVCDNPYYDPDEAGKAEQPSLTVEKLLGTVHDLTTAREAIRQREQRVAVLNRVLRHNLRNEMNVVQTHAELIEDTSDDDDIRDSIGTIRETTDRLLEIAEDARRVQEISAQSVPERRPVDFTAAIEHATTRAQNHYPNVNFECDIDDTWVEGTDHLDVALTELFKRFAEVAEDGCWISVQRKPACGSHGHHCLRIDCDGGGLPDAEIESLSNGIETPLTHSSGLGLWLANWIVELSGGRLLFEEDGSTAIVSLPATDDEV